MAEGKKYVARMPIDELAEIVKMIGPQLQTDRENAGLVAIYSGIDTKTPEGGVFCGHAIHNPHTVAVALLNEALLFGRVDEVMLFIEQLRKTLDLAEGSIKHHVANQSRKN